MKRGYRIAIQFLFALAGLLAFVALVTREPHYHGRTLTSWLQECYDASLDDTKRLAEAEDAVCAIGAKRALPVLLKLAKAHDGPIRSWILKQNERWNIRLLELREDEEKQRMAVLGFEALGTNCAPAVPELARLLNDANLAFTAVRCLFEVGKAAEFALCQGLTNKDSRVRQCSISALSVVTDDVEVYVGRVKTALKDPDGEVHRAALEAIGTQTGAPDVAIPFLVTALGDDSPEAARLLADFGTNALSTCTALSNAVVNGSSETARQALRTLVAIAPAEALPMVLNRLRSPEPRDRCGAVGLLCDYAVTNSEILPALKLAATDPSPIVARPAKLFITDLHRAGRPDEFLIPDEPSDGGKRLGEWLKLRKDGYNFSEESEDALQRIGTNAIPALLARLVYKRPPYDMPARELNMEAVTAFIVLGEHAKPALPKLLALMESDDEDSALRALLAICGAGADAVDCLIRGLTNKHAMVRNESVHYLEDNPGAQFPERRMAAVPHLITLLNDTNALVRINATNALKEIDPSAATKVGVR